MCLSKLDIDCKRCDLWLTRTNIVTGIGNKDAAIMIIGEAPGYYEDKYAQPFIGNSGERLTLHYTNAGFTHDELWITNTIKCRPPANRVPTNMEILKCRENLKYEIDKIKPWIIVPLGATATSIFFPNMKIKLLRGKKYKINNTYLVPMYHPSYALRNKKADEDSYRDWNEVKVLYNKLMEVRILNKL